MPTGRCRLCRSEAELQLSHVIPAFIFRWVRETSGSGYLRFSMEPNKRVQDGVKFYWLCRLCEARFSRYEDFFARHVFHPYVAGAHARIRYGPWLAQFGASLVWRVLNLYQDHGMPGFPEGEMPRVEAAERMWRDFLLGAHRNPEKFEIHLLPVDGLGHGGDVSMWPPTINRYMLRAVDTDVAHGGSTAFVYVKLPRFVFLGFTRLDHPKQWVGTKVHATEGMIEPRRFVLPIQFGEYLSDRAKRMDKVQTSISARQRERINESIAANVDKLAGSDLLTAMQQDVELFGDSAFLENRLKSQRGEREP
jgi:hypothetical protein